MSEQAQELLMMFIRDGYSSSGKVKKSTALKMMRFVENHPELQMHVNNSNNKAILDFRLRTKTTPA
jgi:pyruvate formate-lyase activating enzyme-like uncharacterized protein